MAISETVKCELCQKQFTTDFNNEEIPERVICSQCNNNKHVLKTHHDPMTADKQTDSGIPWL
jgi:hypothetical protein